MEEKEIPTKVLEAEEEEIDDDLDEEEEGDTKENMTRQVQIQKLSFGLTLSTEDPDEKMDYLVDKAVKTMKELE